MCSPCKDCLVLAQCRNKGWLQVLNDCIKVATYIGGHAILDKDTIVRIPSLRRSYTTYKSKYDKNQTLIGPVSEEGNKNE